MYYNKELHDVEKQLLNELMEEKKLSLKSFAKSIAFSSIVFKNRP